MRFLKSIILALLLGACSIVQAQDVHFTMFDMAPLELNPTYTGYYSGTFRIGLLSRSQWMGVSITNDGFGYAGSGKSGFDGFYTPNVYIDVPFGIPNKKTGAMKSWMGVGVSFTMDKVSHLSNMFASLSLAYHIGLGKKGKTILSLAAQGGIAQFRAGSAADYIFEDGIIASGGSQTGIYSSSLSQEAFQDANKTIPDFTGGLMLSHRARNIKFQLGASVNHFTTPEYSFLGSKAKLPMTLIANFIMDADVSKRIRIKPLVFFHNQLTPSIGTDNGLSSYELNAQLLFGYHFTDAKDITLYLGGGYRVSDAAIARLGLDIKGFKFAFAYDFNLNGLSEKAFEKANRGMAFEVALSYIAKLYKVPVVEEVLFCPRF